MTAALRLKTETIKARPHARISDVEAKAIAPELFEIEREYGLVTADEVLKRARSPRNPMHKHIEWDNDKAADSYRVAQARDLIRSIVYEVEVVGGSLDQPTRDFQPVMVNVRSSAEDAQPMPAGYVSVTRALADPTMRAKILEQAARELDAWTRRYHTLELLAESIAAVRATRDRIRKRATALKKRRKEARA